MEILPRSWRKSSREKSLESNSSYLSGDTIIDGSDLKRIESSDLTLRPTMSSTSGRVNSTPDLWNEPTWRSTDAFEDPFVRNAGQAKADGDGLILVHEPDRPVADIVFVHGLGGSSHKSWSYGHDPRNFWPDWLKLEMGLSEARIHTFGYSAGIISQSKKVSIYDFSNRLLFHMKNQTSHLEAKFGSCPIIFVTHSMGGLVIKKAYVDGKIDENYQEMMAQVKAMVFLSTPHQGGNGAKFLDRTLQVFDMSKDYVQEISEGSVFLQNLDRDFSKSCGDLRLFSFYETKKTRVGHSQAYIVDKTSGVLNLPKETIVSIDADHHNVCKFVNMHDARYKTIRGLLTDLVCPLLGTSREEPIASPLSGINALDMVAEVDSVDGSNAVDAVGDLLSIDENKLNDKFDRFKSFAKEGTCTWINERSSFTTWLQGEENGAHVLWICGEPATGKSVLTTYITDVVRNKHGGNNCHYHSFDFSDQPKRSASYLLRSLAYQAARGNERFRMELLRTSEQLGVQFDSMSATAIWEKIFRGVLFKMELDAPLFWIIDGLDESDAVLDLFKCLKSLEKDSRVNILLVSRPTPEITRSMKKLGMKSTTHHISKSDTYDDIETYLQDEIDIPLGIASRQRIVDNVLEKASGSFLWVALVTKELQKSWYRERDIVHTLGGLPGAMKPLYQQMIQRMDGQDQQVGILASKLLTWVTFSFRPLYISELKTALHSETPDLTSLEETMHSICGGFVQIGSTTTRVELIHETARHFLVSSASGRTILKSPAESHEYLASVCLRHLSSKEMGWLQKLQKLEKKQKLEMQHSKAPPLDSPFSVLGDAHPFLSYAAKSWAYHLSLADPNSKELLNLVLVFLKNACLTWINSLALLGDLNTLIQAAQYLKTYIKNKERAWLEQPGIHSEGDDIDQLKLWAVDLIKIVGKFGSNLIQDPGSIYKNVLPFCPTNSIIRKTYGLGLGKFSVSGISFVEWDDCHARLSVGSEATATKVIATAEIFAALVPQEHSLVVWHAKTCRELQRINHGEYVTEVAVNKKGDLVCTSGVKTLKIWEVSSGEEVGRVQKEGNDRVLALSFGVTDDEILVGYQDRLIVTINWRTKTRVPFHAVVSTDPLPPPGLRVISFSPDGSQVAISSRIRPAELWDIATQTRTHCLTLRNETALAREDAFQGAEAIQWHPDSGYLFLIYHNMTMVYWNPVYEEQTETNIKANMILCSPCGKFLLTSNYEGSVKIYTMPDYSNPAQPDFTLLYDLTCHEILDITFSPNGQRFYDLRGSICSAWEPEQLVPAEKIDSDENSTLSDFVLWTTKHTKAIVSSNAQVTAIASAPRNAGFCCGRDDGTLTIHDLEDGKKLRTLSGHSPDVIIIALTWSSSGKWLASGDDSGHILVRSIRPATSGTKIGVRKPSDFRIRDGINQLLFSADDKYLLVATSSSDIIWDVTAKEICSTRPHESQGQAKWAPHPTDKSKLVSIGAEDVHLFSWFPFVDLTPGEGIKYDRGFDENSSNPADSADCSPTFNKVDWDNESLASNALSKERVECVALTKDRKTYIFESLPSSGHRRESFKQRKIELIRTKDLDQPNARQRIPLENKTSDFAHQMSKFVGSYRNELVFFNHQHWLCTWDVETEVKDYRRHFPLPNDWINPETLILTVLNEHGTLLCPRNGEVAVIKNGIRLH